MMHELYLISPTLNFKLHLFGDGPERVIIEEAIQRYNLQESVVLHGVKSNIETLLSDIHFYVHSALNEAFGLVITEAMAASLPVICFNSGGPIDIVEENKNGFLMPINASPKDFAAKIDELVQDPKRYLSFAKSAAERAKMFTIKECAETHFHLYKAQILKIKGIVN